MASLGRMKIYNQSGTFRATMPKEWIGSNRIKSKDGLDIIVTHAIIVLPPRELNNEEMEEVVRDFRQLIKARSILLASKTQETTQNTTKVL
jgi:bifunctional DNA-binding transcriptional regulator/antitoxin component of YhaV-PrlF toxin-antitoxin module